MARKRKAAIIGGVALLLSALAAALTAASRKVDARNSK
jgi:hypothetical protein